MTAILVTRPGGSADPLVAVLAARGYRVVAVPTVTTRAVPVTWPDLGSYHWVVVTSAAGVKAVPELTASPHWAAVGRATAAALRARGWEADFVPIRSNGAGLATELPSVSGTHILVVRASLSDADVSAGLRDRGASVDELIAYETVEGPEESAEELRRTLSDVDLAAVVFASGSAVRGFVKLGGTTTLPAVTIGPRTSAVARTAGFTVLAEAAATDVEQLAAAIASVIPVEVGRPWQA
ncbi:MAG TPA: uroporphyrinogen-III synthase [Candidatus Dormibacteraeota bacterium]|nr:uroporphyrinogen-III synthase [Candidatus Dormibacteraeota bacterium]